MTHPAVNKSLRKPEEMGIVRGITGRQRNRFYLYEARPAWPFRVRGWNRPRLGENAVQKRDYLRNMLQLEHIEAIEQRLWTAADALSAAKTPRYFWR